MRRQVLVILIVAIALVGGPRPAAACSCPPQGTVGLRDHVSRATAVFTGVATAVRGMPFGFTCSSADPVSVEFAVETVYKGDVPATVVLHTVASGASCGYTFTAGERYTVFPSTVSGKLNTGLCQGNVEGTIVAADYGLSEGHPPRN